MAERMLPAFIAVFFVSNTVAVLVMLEILLFGVPYITLFLSIFGVLAYFNLRKGGIRRVFGLKLG